MDALRETNKIIATERSNVQVSMTHDLLLVIRTLATLQQKKEDKKRAKLMEG